MKTLKTLIIAALMCSYLTNCQNAAPTPDTTNTNVVVTPPTPAPTNKCDNVKNPLEEIEWLKEIVKNSKDGKIAVRITQYTYKQKPIYLISTPTTKDFFAMNIFRNCEISIDEKCGGNGDSGCSSMYEDIIKVSINPILLFEQK